MTYNILNGDCLAQTFAGTDIKGDVIVIREALIAGDLSGETLTDFWKSRANYLGVSQDEYQNKVTVEFGKIVRAPSQSEFNLWFEYDLFCQVNMWFVISIIKGLGIDKTVNAVYTSYLDKTNKHFWNGFGPAKTEDLIACYNNRIQFTGDDIKLGANLWELYKSHNLEGLSLAAKNSSSFPHIQEVVQAHIERFPKNDEKGRPERVIEKIIKTNSRDFSTVFKEFGRSESIYGFGDTQIKELYDKVISSQPS